MDDLGRSRGFNPPFDRSVWVWIMGAAVVSIALTYWATSGRERPQVAARDLPTVSEPLLPPPIAQPPAVPPTDVDKL